MKALCLRCDRCRSVCHTGVIGVGGFAEGLLVMRTPVMNFHGGFCDFCRKCAEVCPTGAIRDFDPETEKIGLAHVTETCIALRTAACTACEEACPYDAITLDAQNRPVVDPGLCNGCGKCEQICPANVYQAYRGGRLRGHRRAPAFCRRSGRCRGRRKRRHEMKRNETSARGASKHAPVKNAGSRRLRSLTAAAFIVMTGIGLAWHTGWGTLSSFGIGSIAEVCPLGALEAMLADRTFLPQAFFGLLVVAAVVVLFGRIFCGWVCPVPLLRRITGMKDERPAEKAGACSSKTAACTPSACASCISGGKGDEVASTDRADGCRSGGTQSGHGPLLGARRRTGFFRRLRISRLLPHLSRRAHVCARDRTLASFRIQRAFALHRLLCGLSHS